MIPTYTHEKGGPKAARLVIVRAGHSLSVFTTQSKRRATERNSSARQRSRRGPAGVLFAVAVISPPP
jgi:hypothetical protein